MQPVQLVDIGLQWRLGFVSLQHVQEGPEEFSHHLVVVGLQFEELGGGEGGGGGRVEEGRGGEREGEGRGGERGGEGRGEGRGEERRGEGRGEGRGGKRRGEGRGEGRGEERGGEGRGEGRGGERRGEGRGEERRGKRGGVGLQTLSINSVTLLQLTCAGSVKVSGASCSVVYRSLVPSVLSKEYCEVYCTLPTPSLKVRLLLGCRTTSMTSS